jgi:hypothetical protein
MGQSLSFSRCMHGAKYFYWFHGTHTLRGFDKERTAVQDLLAHLSETTGCLLYCYLLCKTPPTGFQNCQPAAEFMIGSSPKCHRESRL